jgi:hypothetical protein
MRGALRATVRTILSQLDQSQTIEDMRLTSFRLHPLRVIVRGSGPWLSMQTGESFFVLEDGDAKDVELTDSH